MGTTEHWNKGSRVEVTSNEPGFRASWFDAIVIRPPDNPKSDYWEKRLTLIEYTTLLSDDGQAQLREDVDVDFIRPLLPGEGKGEGKGEEKEVVMEKNVVVDAYDREGWWTGEIASVTKQGTYLVAFEEARHVLEFARDRLRLHWDFIDGKWVLPANHAEFSCHLKELIARRSGKEFSHPPKKPKTGELCSKEKWTSQSKYAEGRQQGKRRRLIMSHAGNENASATGSQDKYAEILVTASNKHSGVEVVEDVTGGGSLLAGANQLSETIEIIEIEEDEDLEVEVEVEVEVEAEAESVTDPNQSLAWPFVKTSPIWKAVESLEDLVEVEVYGLNAQVIKSLISTKDEHEKLKKERVQIEEKIEKIIKEMRRLQDELKLALAEKEKKDSEIHNLENRCRHEHEEFYKQFR